ncbi:hypothetical protein B6S12_06090 [Helicobacter valdiviensis]|uniref:L-seryl-tRNA selenium transferase n=1 Tax=Helicobacter valdiviensis TaxID=1458358 RepID=A0A2W6MUE8_9HELI|nr:hypothetical protein [Helicobacter valdiviensis]PZT48032.1 hypothetical protein B6S12_06090 [Helicobacter valdiviensis]
MKQIAGILFFILFLSGCGSKYYYEPKEEDLKGSTSYTNSIPSSIIAISRDGATLKNGNFITKNGEVIDFTLPKNARYLNESESYYLATSNTKELILINKQTKDTIYLNFEANPISASMENNLIAMIFDDNSLQIFDFDTKKTLYKLSNPSAPTNNTLIASPYFLGDIIVMPTLDGKLVIIDKPSMRMIRNIVVNGEKHFNNVIFLDAIGNRMVAATPKRVISVSPSVINTFEVNLKDILFFEDRIFLFSSEGEVILTDVDLNEIKRLKFPFAHFSAPNHGRKINVLETQGYFLSIEDDLSGYEVFEIPSKIKEPAFSAGEKIFVDDSYLDLN